MRLDHANINTLIRHGTSSRLHLKCGQNVHVESTLIAWKKVSMTNRARTDSTAVAHTTSKGSFCVGIVYYEGGSNQSLGIVRKGRAEVQGKA